MSAVKVKNHTNKRRIGTGSNSLSPLRASIDVFDTDGNSTNKEDLYFTAIESIMGKVREHSENIDEGEISLTLHYLI